MFWSGFTLGKRFAIISRVGWTKLLRQVCFSELSLTGGLIFLVGSPEAAGKIQAVQPALIGAIQFGSVLS